MKRSDWPDIIQLLLAFTSGLAIGLVVSQAHGAEMGRGPVVAGRPHTVTLVAAERRTTNSRFATNRAGARIVWAIVPPIQVRETYRFDCEWGLSAGASWSNHAFEDNGHVVVYNPVAIVGNVKDSVFVDGKWGLIVTAQVLPVSGVETWFMPHDDNPVNVDWVKINGKTVFGKEPKR